MQAHVSQVAAIREQIAVEQMAGQLGLHGLNAGTARHEFITAKQERVALLHGELQDLVGDEALALVVETLAGIPEIATRSNVLAVLRYELSKEEERELFCNALQEAWGAVDLLGGGQAPVDLSSVAAFAGVVLLRERLGDEQARKLIFAPSSVKVLPTFNELHATHHLDLGKLATEAGVTYRVIAEMYANEPVSEEEARLVLQIVSRQTGHIYRIEDVDMQLV